MADVCIFNKLLTHQSPFPARPKPSAKFQELFFVSNPSGPRRTPKTTPRKHESLVNDGMITLWETNIAMEYTPEN